MLSGYARSIGVTESDARIARNIHLSVADCKHLAIMLRYVTGYKNHEAARWNEQLIEYLKGAV
jgi:hypothetical protein